MIRASIVGASGYGGGELLRLLLAHPEVEVAQVTSERLSGKFVHTAHPNLRKQTTLKFSTIAELDAVDVLFLCLPHGHASQRFDQFAQLADTIVDLSADFRLPDAADYDKWYGKAHVAPQLLGDFVYGLAEISRAQLVGAKRIACGGCNASATILALKPLADAGLIESVVVEVKAGSSEAGNAVNDASHHPERSGVVRSYKPTAHRHIAEMQHYLGLDQVHFSATSIEMVRGILATCHVFVNDKLADKDLWKLYRGAYADEPFVRLVKERSGIHRYPEPKLLAGTNFCDIGFECDPHANRVVVISAIDNLMKGAAGQAVQAFNIANGFDERAGLAFAGLHPI